MLKYRRLPLLIFCLFLAACSDDATDVEIDEQPTLLTAAEQGDLPSISQLIADDSELDIRDACLWTPLMKAALNGHLEAARQLIAAGADVNLADKGGYSALMLAASNNHTEILDLLLAAGANPDQIEQTGGFTALIWAAQLGHTASVKRLLNSPANRAIRDFDGKSAADWARQNGHQEILTLFKANPQRSVFNDQGVRGFKNALAGEPRLDQGYF
jgi:ankyrin repeat protein